MFEKHMKITVLPLKNLTWETHISELACNF